jgi:hypothetical protein
MLHDRPLTDTKGSIGKLTTARVLKLTLRAQESIVGEGINQLSPGLHRTSQRSLHGMLRGKHLGIHQVHLGDDERRKSTD